MLELDRARPPAPPARPRLSRPAGFLPLAAILALLLGAGGVAAARFIAAAPEPVPVPAPAAPAAVDASGMPMAVGGDGFAKARVPAGHYTVELLVVPARVGFNQLHVTVYAPGGNTARVRTFAARLTPPAGGDPVRPAAERVGGNHFLAASARVPSAGNWTFTLDLMIRELSDTGAVITPERAVQVPVVVPVR